MRTELAIRDLVPDPDLSYRNESASRLHRRAQATLSRRYKSFRSEVPLTGNVDLGSRSITVTGRLDGLRRARSGVCLYEIKSVPEPARDWIHSPTLQRARWQLLLYGDLYRLVFDGTPGRLILLLIDPAGRIAEEDIDPSSCRGLLSRRLPTIQRDSSRPGPFPEPIVSQLQRFIADDHRHDREIQTEALRSVAQHPDSDRLLFAMPPGSGKTRIALRIALEAAARDRLPVHWITMKSEGRQTVLNELDRYRAAGLSLRHVWKAPPERLCRCDSPSDECPNKLATRERIFFGDLQNDRSRQAAADLCAHEWSRHLEPTSEIVVADLNYLLDRSSLHRPAIRVLDEVQNLPDRHESFFGSTVTLAEIRSLLRRLPASRRARFRSLVEPEWLDDCPPCAPVGLWPELAALLTPETALSDLTERLMRLARSLTRFGNGYRVVWTTDSRGNPAWHGFIVDPTSIIRDLSEASHRLIALSGSLARCERSTLFRAFTEFDVISPPCWPRQPVAIVPQLDFRYPISQRDLSAALECLLLIHRHTGATVAVFGQNRESNRSLQGALTVRGRVVLDESDLNGDWSLALDVRPDFLFSSLGGNASESVNPPDELFSCAVVLSAGHRPQEPAVVGCEAMPDDDLSDNVDSIRPAMLDAGVSRVVQATGRVNRSPSSERPIFLLNRSFARSDYLERWPANWYDSYPREMIHGSLKDAFTNLGIEESAPNQSIELDRQPNHV